MSHYDDEFDRLTKMYTEEFKEHRLERVSEDPPIFYMHRPDSGLYHLHFCFLGGKIVIFGDAMLGYLGRGVISTPGYGLDWFTGQLDPGYLAEKFIARAWCEELAEDFLETELADTENLDDNRKMALEWIKNGGDLCRDAFMREWVEHMVDTDDWPSESYNPAEISMLHVIQMRFAELHREL
jgi:hypothetical protein